MKKAVLILLALLMVASLATAQGVKIGGWGRGFMAVAGSTAPNQDVVFNPAAIGWWAGNGPRIGINIIGSSENIGFQIDMNVDPGAVSATSTSTATQMTDPAVPPQIPLVPANTWFNVATTTTISGNPVARGDQQKIWVKPISMVTIQMGYSTYDDALRGSASFGIYNWIRFGGTPGDGFIFQRVGTAVGSGGDSGGANFEVAIDPIEGLHAFAAFTPGAGSWPAIKDAIVSNAMYGAGYTIPGIGMIRAQWLGINPNGGQINAAFKLTAVSGLTADLGTYVAMADGKMGNIEINLFASYAVMPTLTLNAIASLKMVKAATDYMNIYGGIEGEYALPGDMVVTGDVRVSTSTASGAKLTYGALLAIQKNFSNGLVGLGVEFTNMGFASPAPSVNADQVGWAIPLRVEYWF